MYDTIDGPEWLDNQADRLSGQNLTTEATPYRTLAELWRSDQKTIAQLQDENTDLQRRLDGVRGALCARA